MINHETLRYSEHDAHWTTQSPGMIDGQSKPVSVHLSNPDDRVAVSSSLLRELTAPAGSRAPPRQDENAFASHLGQYLSYLLRTYTGALAFHGTQSERPVAAQHRLPDKENPLIRSGWPVGMIASTASIRVALR